MSPKAPSFVNTPESNNHDRSASCRLLRSSLRLSHALCLRCLPIIRPAVRLGDLQRSGDRVHGHCNCLEQQRCRSIPDHRTVDMDTSRGSSGVPHRKLRVRCLQLCNCVDRPFDAAELWPHECKGSEGCTRQREDMAVVEQNADGMIVNVMFHALFRRRAYVNSRVWFETSLVCCDLTVNRLALRNKVSPRPTECWHLGEVSPQHRLSLGRASRNSILSANDGAINSMFSTLRSRKEKDKFNRQIQCHLQ